MSGGSNPPSGSKVLCQIKKENIMESKFRAITIWTEDGKEQWDLASLDKHDTRAMAQIDVEGALRGWRKQDIVTFKEMNVRGKVITEAEYQQKLEEDEKDPDSHYRQ